MKENRPWGSYRTLEETSYCKVKTIQVRPGQALSYQTHKLRSEDWTIVSGSGYVILDGDYHRAMPGDKYKIEAGQKHRAGCLPEDPGMVFIEIQSGDYFGEDDIVRYEDMYDRS